MSCGIPLLIADPSPPLQELVTTVEAVRGELSEHHGSVRSSRGRSLLGAWAGGGGGSGRSSGRGTPLASLDSGTFRDARSRNASEVFAAIGPAPPVINPAFDGDGDVTVANPAFGGESHGPAELIPAGLNSSDSDVFRGGIELDDLRR